MDAGENALWFGIDGFIFTQNKNEPHIFDYSFFKKFIVTMNFGVYLAHAIYVLVRTKGKSVILGRTELFVH